MVTHRLHERNGKFYVVINDKDESGKRFQKWISTGLDIKNNKRKAQDLMPDIVAEYERQKQAAATPELSMPGLVDKWLKLRETIVRENTYNTYKDTAEVHVKPYFKKLGIPANEIQPIHIQEYYAAKIKEVAPATLEKHRTVIKGAFDFGIVTLQTLERNPVDHVPLPRKEKRIPKFYTKEQLLELFKAVHGESIETPVKLCGTFGLRRSEALGLQWSAVDFDHNCLYIYHTAVRTGSRVLRDNLTKNKASCRTMPLTQTMTAYLRQLKEHQVVMAATCGKGYQKNDYVCKWDDGRPLDPDYVSSRFKRFLEEKGLPHIRFHDLRHSSASLLINEGFTLKEVQEWLGQASAASTEIYSHMLYKAKEGMAHKVNNALGALDTTPPTDAKPKRNRKPPQGRKPRDDRQAEFAR